SEGIGRLVVAGAGHDDFLQPIWSTVRTRSINFYDPQSVIQVAAGGGVLIAGDDAPDFYREGAVYLHRTGTFFGSGTILGDFIIGRGALYNPGRSPGSLVINGNFQMEEASTLRLEIGGLVPQVGYDQLIVTGDATLGGTIDIRWLNGFAAKPGDVFE